MMNEHDASFFWVIVVFLGWGTGLFLFAMWRIKWRFGLTAPLFWFLTPVVIVVAYIMGGSVGWALAAMVAAMVS